MAFGLLAGLSLASAPLAGQSWRSVTMSRQVAGEDELRVEVGYGAGRFKVGPAEPGVLYRMQLRYDEEIFEPRADFDGKHLELGLESLGKRIRMGKRSEGEMDVRLARDVPMSLDLDFGAVRAELDLGGLSLLELSLSTGASESVMDVSASNPSDMRLAKFEVGAADFTARRLGNLNARHIDVDAGVGELSLSFEGEWRHDATVSIDLGLGALELVVPEGLGVRLEKDSFLTALDSEGLVKRGDAYYSLDWETAEKRITIDLDAAFGSVRVVWVR